MTAHDIWFRPSGRWTTDDLDGLPEDNRRRELIDGALVVPPAPTPAHQNISARLMVALYDTCPSDLHVTQGMQIRFSTTTAVVADGLVTTAAATARNPTYFAPHDVVVAVEVVAEGSRTMDRITKPALYAGAGIPHYWRVETSDMIVVHAYKLDPVEEVYRPVGEFTDEIEVAEPWPIRVPISRLRPRHL